MQPKPFFDGPGGQGRQGGAFMSGLRAQDQVERFHLQPGRSNIPAGNDTALSIPIAAQAGLGELSRMGTLVTEEYGSRVRLAKVFTDLEIKPDRPKTFGVWAFCKRCKKCAGYQSEKPGSPSIYPVP